ncbi:MAG: hypothetical protein B7Y39_13315 [Bdellovibrio sp. 28-41-41]|nr:MAG: hypothetical protein B7Y39_13315 [Bdellovibrio sp. 28-41-41]
MIPFFTNYLNRNHQGWGRTDFQQGSSDTLFNSVRNILFALPEETIIYPGHDYKGHTSSSIGEEKKFNSRLKPFLLIWPAERKINMNPDGSVLALTKSRRLT